MTQSSILGWLSKPSAAPENKVKTSAIESSSEQELLTPPPSLQVNPTNPSYPSSIDQSSSLDSPVIKKLPSIPPNLELRACRKEDIPALKQINSLLLPIPYPESFYREIVSDPQTNNITLLAIWHADQKSRTQPNESHATQVKGQLIGAIRCKLLSPLPAVAKLNNEAPMLYLSTLVLLSPYRSQGIATQMLDQMTKRAVRDYGVGTVGAHVWEANQDALSWYRKRGFSEVAREAGYYRRLDPQDAIVVSRRIGVMDVVGG